MPIDGHVHLYACFDLSVLLDSACRHFATLDDAPKAGQTGILMLAETARENRFAELREWAAKDRGAGAWRFLYDAGDPLCIRALNARRSELLLIAGRQVVSREGLEILTLATAARVRDGMPAKETIEAALDAEAVTVLPWAVGKWLGRRGRLVRELIASELARDLMLGDISGRPSFWMDPAQLQQGRRTGMRILPGTDPLPLRGEERRVGSFGCTLEARLSGSRPSEDLKRVLRDHRIHWRPYGRLENPFRFLRNQLALRLPAAMVAGKDDAP